jgi:ribosomal protein L6P/L9E
MGGRDIKEIEIPKGVKATLNENEIILEGHDIELLGNLAGLIENSVKPKEKDLRKFQDGIYIIQKP